MSWWGLARTLIHLKLYPNIDQYLWNLRIKFQLDSTVGFGVVLNSEKLDNIKFYAKIRPYLDRIINIKINYLSQI
jgi:hypothetical protein